MVENVNRLEGFLSVMNLLKNEIDKTTVEAIYRGASGSSFAGVIHQKNPKSIRLLGEAICKSGLPSKTLVELLKPRGLREAIKAGDKDVLRAYADVIRFMQSSKASKLDKKDAERLWKTIKAEHMDGTLWRANIPEYAKMDRDTLEYFRAAKKLLQKEHYK